jgi:hypothetical protein
MYNVVVVECPPKLVREEFVQWPKTRRWWPLPSNQCILQRRHFALSSKIILIFLGNNLTGDIESCTTLCRVHNSAHVPQLVHFDLYWWGWQLVEDTVFCAVINPVPESYAPSSHPTTAHPHPHSHPHNIPTTPRPTFLHQSLHVRQGEDLVRLMQTIWDSWGQCGTAEDNEVKEDNKYCGWLMIMRV